MKKPLLLFFVTVLATAFYSQVVVATDADTLAKFNFSFDASYEVADWTTVYGTDASPIEGDNEITLIIDGGYLSLGSSGSPFSSAVPDLVSNTYNWMSNENETPVQLILTGLDAAKTYDFHIYASRDSATASGDRTTTYTVVGTTISGSINPVGNTANFVDLLDVTPATTGGVVIELTKLVGQYGYINALIICENVDVTGVEEIAQTEISYYPVPVKDYLHLNNLPKMSNVTAYDITGRRVFEQFSEGQSLSVDMTRMNSGVYVVKIENSGSMIKSFKLIKR